MPIEFEELKNIIFEKIKPKLENNDALSIFARERAKFEGWLKVELCESLSNLFTDIIPEKERIDVTFSDWAIELKTLNTNYRFKNVENKTRPITNNIQGVIDDIENLKSSNIKNKAILFVVFPVSDEVEKWKELLIRITSLLKRIEYMPFVFKNGIPGITYFGLI